jgi:phosphoglycerol transferase MdoB-like AlkP superfamily enzyme
VVGLGFVVGLVGVFRDLSVMLVTSFGWFLLALTLLFIAVILSRPYAVVDALLIPIILAPTISLMIYLTLATTVIKHMQSPRDNQGG